VKYLPAPKTPGMLLQKHFEMPSPTYRDGKHIGFGYQGFIDLWLPDSVLAPGLLHPPYSLGVPLVGDFKTTVDIDRYSKTEKTLATDPQAVLYATHAMFETGARAVDVAWMNSQTRGTKKSKRVHLRLTADHTCNEFGKINDTAIEMLGVRLASPHPTDLPATPSMCSAYGGCPHQSYCISAMSPAQVIESAAASAAKKEEELMSNISGQTSSLLKKLQAQKAGAQQPASAPSVANTTAGAAAPAPVVAPPLPAPAPSPAPPAVEQPLPGWMTSPADPRTQVVGINPPEAALPPAPALNSVQPAAEAPAKAKRGPGRPPKTQPDPKGADAALFTNLPAPPAQTTVVNASGPNGAELVRIAKALRAGCDAFLALMEAA
jgi:hypothetical protein